jgi:hypothetical protein
VPSFGSNNIKGYEDLLAEWLVLTHHYTGWTLTEIKDLSPRERTNWIALANELGKALRKRD